MTGATLPDRIEDRLPSTRREALHLLGVLLLVAIVIPFVIFAVPQVAGADQSYVVLSGSMEPTVSPGDVVIVNEVPAEEIERGDVITFGGDARTPPTTHRVVDLAESNGERYFVTKGDNNENADAAPVPASDLRGKVVELPFAVPLAGHSLLVIPLIGHLAQFTNTPAGFVVLVGIPLVLFGGSELLTFVRATRAEGSAPADDDQVGETEKEESAEAERDDARESGARAADVKEESDGAAAFAVTGDGVVVAVAGLSALAAASGYRAYLSMTALAAAVAAGAAMLCLLLIALVLLDDGSGSPRPARSPTESPPPGESSKRDSAATADAAAAEHAVVGTGPAPPGNSGNGPESGTPASTSPSEESDGTATRSVPTPESGGERDGQQ